MNWIVSQLVCLLANWCTLRVRRQESTCRYKCCVYVAWCMSCHWQSTGFGSHNSQSDGYWQTGTTVSNRTTTDAQCRQSWSWFIVGQAANEAGIRSTGMTWPHLVALTVTTHAAAFWIDWTGHRRVDSRTCQAEVNYSSPGDLIWMQWLTSWQLLMTVTGLLDELSQVMERIASFCILSLLQCVPFAAGCLAIKHQPVFSRFPCHSSKLINCTLCRSIANDNYKFFLVWPNVSLPVELSHQTNHDSRWLWQFAISSK